MFARRFEGVTDKASMNVVQQLPKRLFGDHYENPGRSASAVGSMGFVPIVGCSSAITRLDPMTHRRALEDGQRRRHTGAR